MPILIEDSARPVGRVHDLIVDPENGNLIAFTANSRGNKVIAPRDVLKFGRHLLIRDHEDICDTGDILRVSEVQERAVPIMKNKVEAEKGEYLGRVFDYVVDTKAQKLIKLYVAKSLLGLLRVDVRIISAKYIVEITPNVILIKDSLAKIPIEEEHEELRVEEMSEV
ncbi:hypothetical protein KKG51_00865 [Patescibacteria group bacterium]|nr:hypothetical protein [Patescibacteria group bacterium]